MPLFSQHMRTQAQAGFQSRLPWTGSAGEDIAARLEALPSRDLADAVRWLYAASPLSDWLNYPFALFQSCGEHGVFLRERSPFAREVPEDMFLHYVLHIRVNEEELSDCRKVFYDLLAPRLQGLAPWEAVLEANYWCAEQAAYQSTDARTRSALAVWRSGFGRCGEESTFAVCALRSVGIPARQVYTPRWAHCDDNHAWVEVWADGGWHFLGACEPEEVLDRGWFTSAASRAMVIHSRRFAPPDSEDAPDAGEEVLGRSGAVTYLNQLPRYADTKRLTVHVTAPSGGPVEGAEVAFGILNLSEVYPAAVLETGPDGTARLTCGLGSFLIRVRKDGAACERLVHTPDADTVEMVLEQDAPVLGVWEDFAFTAPRDRPSPAPKPTQEQKALGRRKAAAAARKRVRRALPPTAAERFLADRRFSREEKESLLGVLSRKDLLDADLDALAEALETSRESGVQGDLFWPCVACPRVADEPLRPSRRAVWDYFPEEQRRGFQARPREIWDFLQERVRYVPALESSQLATLPAAALRWRSGSPLSQRILFVSICRALGVPARLDPADGQPEYWDGQGFQAADAPEKSCAVILEKGPEERWQYWTDFTVGALEDGACRTLEASHIPWEGDRLTVPLRPGDYRILTDNRLPNGDIFASKYHFRLEAGGTKTVRLHKYQADLARMLDNYALEEFTVSAMDGRTVPGSELTGEKSVLLWLDAGAEPTEHLLGEILERREAFRRLRLVFLAPDRSALENSRLRQALEALPDSLVCLDRENAEPIARRMYVDPEKLPLIVVTAKPLNAVYASSGYNVGSGEMILRVWDIS